MKLYFNEEMYVEEAFLKLLKELSKKEYEISIERLYEILQRKFSVSIITQKQPNISNNFQSLDSNISFQQLSPNNGCSHILEYPPIYVDDHFSPFIPIINIVRYPEENEFESSTYHELSHLFSSSPWTPLDNFPLVLQHISGINVDNYDYSENRIKKLSVQNLTLIDEFLNDFIAMLLYQLIEGKSYFLHFLNANKRNFFDFIRKQINKNSNGNYKNLIKQYFSNDIIGIEEILLSNSEFKSLKELENRFSNKKINYERD